MIREKQGKFVCTNCNFTYSSMLGDDEVPEVCEECEIHYIDDKRIYNYKLIENDDYEPNKECTSCDVEYTCWDCEAEQIRERYPEARYTDHLEWIVPNGAK